ncbi:3,4-dihydroxy-2-butanone-4-phosphate synthase [Alkalihalobacillus sp. TS-13]|uniref:3,4-dihydroxy-2-butanone-4-phosphate synthase n=1 Tax=Alkalihalobacillus sp. TS-13 TaxID=2842455 RepID=UPI001C8770A6|nr:3,4-dihydroxy-2-butanone-4-phosphate synthase [Alkalihalobacillus sp. TS-13]
MQRKKCNRHDVLKDTITIIFDDVSTQTSFLMGIGDHATADDVNFMAKYGKGLIYCCITEKIAESLQLPLLQNGNGFSENTFNNMTVSIDFKTSTTGISAFERADTIRNINCTTNSEDFKRPGHIFPLVSNETNLIRNAGIAEASIEWARSIKNDPDYEPTTYVCEILNTSGEVANQKEVNELAYDHGLDIIKISEIIERYLQEHTSMKIIEQTKFSMFNQPLNVYRVKNEISPTPLTVYLNPRSSPITNMIFYQECLVGDLLGLKNKCNCPKHLKGHLVSMLNGELDCVIYQRNEASSIPSNYKNLIISQLQYLFENETYQTEPMTSTHLISEGRALSIH